MCTGETVALLRSSLGTLQVELGHAVLLSGFDTVNALQVAVPVSAYSVQSRFGLQSIHAAVDVDMQFALNASVSWLHESAPLSEELRLDVLLNDTQLSAVSVLELNAALVNGFMATQLLDAGCAAHALGNATSLSSVHVQSSLASFTLDDRTPLEHNMSE